MLSHAGFHSDMDDSLTLAHMAHGLELQRPVSQFWLALVRGAGGD